MTTNQALGESYLSAANCAFLPAAADPTTNIGTHTGTLILLTYDRVKLAMKEATEALSGYFPAAWETACPHDMAPLSPQTIYLPRDEDIPLAYDKDGNFGGMLTYNGDTKTWILEHLSEAPHPTRLGGAILVYHDPRYDEPYYC